MVTLSQQAEPRHGNTDAWRRRKAICLAHETTPRSLGPSKVENYSLWTQASKVAHFVSRRSLPTELLVINLGPPVVHGLADRYVANDEMPS